MRKDEKTKKIISLIRELADVIEADVDVTPVAKPNPDLYDKPTSEPMWKEEEKEAKDRNRFRFGRTVVAQLDDEGVVKAQTVREFIVKLTGKYNRNLCKNQYEFFTARDYVSAFKTALNKHIPPDRPKVLFITRTTLNGEKITA